MVPLNLAWTLSATVVIAFASSVTPAAENQEPLISRMDKNKILIELSASPRSQYGKVAYEEQSAAQQVFSVVWDLDSEVNNGGFAQYFANSSGDTAVHAPAALRAIAAHRAADIVAKAVELFPSGAPPTDRDTRKARVAAASTEVRSAWDRLDQEFYAYPDDLTSLLYAWVKAHPGDFGPVP